MALRHPFWSANHQLQNAARNRGALRRGDRGEAVVLLQRALRLLGYPLPGSIRPDGTADGIFGPETERVVHGFEFYNGLTVDRGIAGRQVLTTMDSHLYQVPNEIVTLRQRAVQILRSRTNVLRFQYGGRAVRPGQFGELARQIVAGRLGIAYQTRATSASASYGRVVNTMFFKIHHQLGPSEESLFIHESCHAISDIARRSIWRPTEEAIGYTAQNIYRRHFNLPRSRASRRWESHPATQRLREAANRAGDEIFLGRAPSPETRRELEDAIASHPVYASARGGRGIRHLLEFDGTGP
jgi:hypothetical protein